MNPLDPTITYEVDLSRSWRERIPRSAGLWVATIAGCAFLIAVAFATLPGSEPRSNTLLPSHTGDMKDRD